jgi:hypothetical protein
LTERVKWEAEIPSNQRFGASDQLSVQKFFFFNGPTLRLTSVGQEEEVSGSQTQSNDGFHI